VSKTEFQTQFDERGDFRLNYTKLDPELIATLAALSDSYQWKAYRDLLINAKNHFFDSTLAIDDTNKLLKHIGIVAGINFAINQLPILVQQHRKALEKEQAK